MKDTIVVRPRRDPSATKRFICLGFCGGGAGSYVKWADAMPSGMEFAAICYPGREGRFVDDFAGDWDELVDDTLDAVVSAGGRHSVRPVRPQHGGLGGLRHRGTA